MNTIEVRACAGLVAALLTVSVAVGAPVYLESGGQIVGEGELYSARTAAAGGTTWLVVPDEDAGAGPAINNARGGKYVQLLPDDQSPGGPRVNPKGQYQMQISTPGTYRLWLRWDGNNTNGTTRGQSDSIFVNIVELSDGAGGAIADWYELTEGVNGDFGNPAWDGGGGFEQNAAGAANDPMTWDIPSPGLYTLEINQREDGAAVDAFVLQLDSLTAPSGNGPARSSVQLDTSLWELIASSDAYVRLGEPTTKKGGESQVVVKDSGGGSTTRKGYLQFDLSELQNPISEAELELVVSTNNQGGGSQEPANFLVNVYGLEDDFVPGPGILGNDWSEAELDWANAPANGANNAITSDAVLLGQFNVTDSDVVGTVMNFGQSDAATQQSLLDFLNADTDGLVTFILQREGGNSGNNLGFASRENGLLTAPILRVEAVVPEPATIGLLAVGAVGLLGYGRRRRKR